eukprot:gene1914-1159_t
MRNHLFSVLISYSSSILQRKSVYYSSVENFVENGIEFMNCLTDVDDQEKTILDILKVSFRQLDKLTFGIALHYFVNIILFFNRDLIKISYWILHAKENLQKRTNKWLLDNKNKEDSKFLMGRRSTNWNSGILIPSNRERFFFTENKVKNILLPWKGDTSFLENFPSTGCLFWCLFEAFPLESSENVIEILRKFSGGLIIQKEVQCICKEMLLLKKVFFIDRVGEKLVDRIQKIFHIPVFKDSLDFLFSYRKGDNFSTVCSQQWYCLKRKLGIMVLEIILADDKKPNHCMPKCAESEAETIYSTGTPHPYVSEVANFFSFQKTLLVCLLKDTMGMDNVEVRETMENPTSDKLPIIFLLFPFDRNAEIELTRVTKMNQLHLITSTCFKAVFLFFFVLDSFGSVLLSYSYLASSNHLMSNDNWGEMVMPGVFMIRGNIVSNDPLSRTTESTAYSHPELIHHDIKQLEAIVTKLKESNLEIASYLSDSTREKGQNDDRRLASTSGEVCDSDEEFREAMKENEHVIREKENEIKRLHELIQVQHCGTDLHQNQKVESKREEPEEEEEIESPIHIDM